jgi:hypothetical protein
LIVKIKGLKKTRGLTALAVTAPIALGAAAAAAPAVATDVQTMMSCGTSVANLDAVAYADRFVRAWGRGDRAITGCYGTTATTRGLYGQATPGGIHWRRVSTEGAAGTIYVTYHDDARGGNLTVGVQNVGLRAAGGWHAAASARFRGEPQAWNAVQWSDNLIRAWGRGDAKWMSYYATPTVMRSLMNISATSGTAWRRISAEGAAGSTYVTYRNDFNGRQLVVGVSNVGLSQGDAHAADWVQYR